MAEDQSGRDGSIIRRMHTDTVPGIARPRSGAVIAEDPPEQGQKEAQVFRYKGPADSPLDLLPGAVKEFLGMVHLSRGRVVNGIPHNVHTLVQSNALDLILDVISDVGFRTVTEDEIERAVC